MKGESHVKKTIVALTSALALGFAGLFSGGSVQAASIDSLQQKKNNIQEKKSAVESDISEANGKINEIESQKNEVKAELNKLQKSITETHEKIKEKNSQITSTQEKITSLKENIKVIEGRIETRNEILKERARSYQQNGGGVNYLEVVFGASSFGEFVERIGAVSTIMQADKEILIEQEKDKADLVTKKEEVEDKLSKLNEMKKELVTINEKLDGQKVEKNKMMAILKSEQAEIEEEKLSLEEEKKLLASQAEAVKKAIQQEKDRQAEEAKKVSASTGGGSGNTVAAPAVTSGKFMRPAAGYVSSGFGGRWGRNHNGIDIAKSGTVPVVASAAGVVTRSNYSSSYGNVIYLSHYIDGQVYTTVYAHLSSRNVSEGQSVSKGQQIGIMGNTGNSYGQHLHFELYVGEWTASKKNAVNPLNYLSGM